MKDAQTLNSLSSEIINGLNPIIEEYSPKLLLVQGDTTTTYIAPITAFYNKVEVGHIEAGLRTGDINSPWPEEANRKMTSIISNYHFAPTNVSMQNLLDEKVNKESIAVTGNTVIDALIYTKSKVLSNEKYSEPLKEKFKFIHPNKKTILVTCHRRESFGGGFKRICHSIKKIAETYEDIQIVFPVHLNPNVQKPVNEILSEIQNIFLIPPQSYYEFIYLMNSVDFILTDSGGIQEEAPSLGKPVLVLRDNSERPEAINAGTVKIVGTDPDLIFNETVRLIEDRNYYDSMSLAHNPYGDGQASKKITKFLTETYKK